MTRLLVVSDDAGVIASASQLTWCQVVVLRDLSEWLTEKDRSTVVLLDLVYLRDRFDVIQHYLDEQFQVLLVAEPAQQAEIEALLKRGADDYLLKPVSLLMLEKRVRRIADTSYIAEFMGTVAHDLKGPLVPILGWADLILSTLEQVESADENLEQIPRWLKVIRTNAVRMEYMISDLRDLALLDAGRRLQVLPNVIDLKALILKVLDLAENQLVERNLTLNLALPDDLPAVLADDYFLMRIVWNLLRNAVIFSEDGTTLTMSAHVSGDNIEIAIRDETEGRQHFPEELARAAQTGRESLRITLAMIHQSGGDIWAENNADRGVTVHFTLPIAPTLPDE